MLRELEEFTLAEFERSLGDLGPKARAAVKRIEDACVGFSSACTEFESLAAEPYVQNLYFPNIASIKSQKVSYARALRHAMSGMELNADKSSNTYDRYSGILSVVDSVTTDVLTVNANFKNVLYCYSNNIGYIKRSFASIEKDRESLRNEIVRRSGIAAQHSRLTERVLALSAILEESKALVDEAAAMEESLSDGNNRAIASEEAEIAGEIAKKKDKLFSVDASLSRLSGEMGALTVPLERPARKYDHLSVRKAHLHPMITDPAGNITDRDTYTEFIGMVRELRNNVESEAIEIKGKEGALSVIDRLLASDLYAMIESLGSKRKEHAGIDAEIRLLEDMLSKAKKGKLSVEKKREEIKRMRERSEELARSVDPAKSEIGFMYFEFYRKRIIIVL